MPEPDVVQPILNPLLQPITDDIEPELATDSLQDPILIPELAKSHKEIDDNTNDFATQNASQTDVVTEGPSAATNGKSSMHSEEQQATPPDSLTPTEPTALVDDGSFVAESLQPTLNSSQSELATSIQEEHKGIQELDSVKADEHAIPTVDDAKAPSVTILDSHPTESETPAEPEERTISLDDQIPKEASASEVRVDQQSQPDLDAAKDDVVATSAQADASSETKAPLADEGGYSAAESGVEEVGDHTVAPERAEPSLEPTESLPGADVTDTPTQPNEQANEHAVEAADEEESTDPQVHDVAAPVVASGPGLEVNEEARNEPQIKKEVEAVAQLTPVDEPSKGFSAASVESYADVPEPDVPKREDAVEDFSVDNAPAIQPVAEEAPAPVPEVAVPLNNYLHFEGKFPEAETPAALEELKSSVEAATMQASAERHLYANIPGTTSLNEGSAEKEVGNMDEALTDVRVVSAATIVEPASSEKAAPEEVEPHAHEVVAGVEPTASEPSPLTEADAEKALDASAEEIAAPELAVSEPEVLQDLDLSVNLSTNAATPGSTVSEPSHPIEADNGNAVEPSEIVIPATQVLESSVLQTEAFSEPSVPEDVIKTPGEELLEDILSVEIKAPEPAPFVAEDTETEVEHPAEEVDAAEAPTIDEITVQEHSRLPEASSHAPESSLAIVEDVKQDAEPSVKEVGAAELLEVGEQNDPEISPLQEAVIADSVVVKPSEAAVESAVSELTTAEVLPSQAVEDAATEPLVQDVDPQSTHEDLAVESGDSSIPPPSPPAEVHPDLEVETFAAVAEDSPTPSTDPPEVEASYLNASKAVVPSVENLFTVAPIAQDFDDSEVEGKADEPSVVVTPAEAQETVGHAVSEPLSLEEEPLEHSQPTIATAVPEVVLEGVQSLPVAESSITDNTEHLVEDDVTTTENIESSVDALLTPASPAKATPEIEERDDSAPPQLPEVPNTEGIITIEISSTEETAKLESGVQVVNEENTENADGNHRAAIPAISSSEHLSFPDSTTTTTVPETGTPTILSAESQGENTKETAIDVSVPSQTPLDVSASEDAAALKTEVEPAAVFAHETPPLELGHNPVTPSVEESQPVPTPSLNETEEAATPSEKSIGLDPAGNTNVSDLEVSAVLETSEGEKTEEAIVESIPNPGDAVETDTTPVEPSLEVPAASEGQLESDVDQPAATPVSAEEEPKVEAVGASSVSRPDHSPAHSIEPTIDTTVVTKEEGADSNSLTELDGHRAEDQLEADDSFQAPPDPSPTLEDSASRGPGVVSIPSEIASLSTPGEIGISVTPETPAPQEDVQEILNANTPAEQSSASSGFEGATVLGTDASTTGETSALENSFEGGAPLVDETTGETPGKANVAGEASVAKSVALVPGVEDQVHTQYDDGSRVLIDGFGPAAAITTSTGPAALSDVLEKQDQAGEAAEAPSMTQTSDSPPEGARGTSVSTDDRNWTNVVNIRGTVAPEDEITDLAAALVAQESSLDSTQDSQEPGLAYSVGPAGDVEPEVSSNIRTPALDQNVTEVVSSESPAFTLDLQANPALDTPLNSIRNLPTALHESEPTDEVTAPQVPIIREPVEDHGTVKDSTETGDLEDGKAISRPSSPWTLSYSVVNQGADIDSITSQAGVLEADPSTLTTSPSPRATTPDIIDRPKSPWTPSYSVVVQGSPYSPKAELPQDDDISPPVILLSNVAPESDATATTDDEHHVSLGESTVQDTTAANVNVPGSEPTSESLPTIDEPLMLAVDALREETTVPPEPFLASPNEAAEPSLDSSAQYTNGTHPTELDSLSSNMQVVADKSEPSSRPWTPSYSVVQQGPEVNQVSEQADAQQQESYITPSTDVAELQRDLALTEAAPELPSRPWTPSYSVVIQGSQTRGEDAPALAPNAISDEQDVFVQPATPVEFPTQANKLTLDFGSVTEGQDTLGDILPSPRSRLESTASSLFFPGGWYGKAPLGRASLDNAQGEFVASSKPTSPIDLTTAPPPTPLSPSDEKKDRWGCILM